MSLILQPGSAPPMLTPYCARCDQPVERYCMDIVKAGLEDMIGIHAQCCGYTSSTRVKLTAYLRLLKEPGAKLYVIVRKGGTPGIRERKRSNFAGYHEPKGVKVA